MKKIAVLVGVLALLALAVLPGFAKAEKAALFTSHTCALVGTEPVAGFVILNNPRGSHNIMVNVQVKNGVPGDYVVWLGDACSSWQNIGTMSVATNGKGSFHLNHNLTSGTYEFTVALNSPMFVTRYLSTPIDITLK